MMMSLAVPVPLDAGLNTTVPTDSQPFAPVLLPLPVLALVFMLISKSVPEKVTRPIWAMSLEAPCVVLVFGLLVIPGK